MLEPAKTKSDQITGCERKNDCLYMYSEAGMLRVMPKGADAVRITYTVRNEFSERPKPGVTDRSVYDGWSFEESDGSIVFSTDMLRIVFDRKTSAASFLLPSGRLLLAEDADHPRTLEEFETFRLADGASFEKEKIKTADGEKELIKSAAKVSDGNYFHTRQYFCFRKDEALYGLGQHEENILDLRGRTVYLHQANRKIAVPVMLSSLGYGLLFDCYSPMIFSDNEFGSYVYCEAAEEIDYYFILGQTEDGSSSAVSAMDACIAVYRRLTGKAALLPRWAFGYVQSQERYENSKELTDTVREFRSRHIGLDCIVQDWLSWPDGQWGQKSFDENRYADPERWLKELHDEHTHFMISIWPNMAEECADHREFREFEKEYESAEDDGQKESAHLLLPGSNVYNALDERARKLYWKQVNEGLCRYGTDAWWCDSSEPYTPEWMHKDKPEPGRMYEEYCNQAGEHMPLHSANAFALYHAQSLYEGQRSANEKRVVNLTRSSYLGQQRYGTVLWSGDTAASWDTLKAQITMGLSFCASGLPYWTNDIGAFFVKNGDNWYWKGDYPRTSDDPAYCELYVRWFEWACFLPMLRAHGTDLRREPWNFMAEGGIFYEALKKNIELRYSLLPHIYSLAGLAWLMDRSIIRMLSFDYPSDPAAKACKEQYLLGDSMMICPVTGAMYYDYSASDMDGESRICDKDRENGVIPIYLPEGGWSDFCTGKQYEGGRTIEAEAPLDRIPVFVKAGSIIPVMIPEEWAYDGYITDVPGKLKFKVYPGADGEYLLYDDAGDGYGYEKGDYRLLKLTWDDREHKLSCEALHGRLPEWLAGNLTEYISVIY